MLLRCGPDALARGTDWTSACGSYWWLPVSQSGGKSVGPAVLTADEQHQPGEGNLTSMPYSAGGHQIGVREHGNTGLPTVLASWRLAGRRRPGPVLARSAASVAADRGRSWQGGPGLGKPCTPCEDVEVLAELSRPTSQGAPGRGRSVVASRGGRSDSRARTQRAGHRAGTAQRPALAPGLDDPLLDHLRTVQF